MPCIESVLCVWLVVPHQCIDSEVSVCHEHMWAEPTALEVVKRTLEALRLHVITGPDLCRLV